MSQFGNRGEWIGNSENIRCAVCDQSLSRMTDDARHLHYETHIDENARRLHYEAQFQGADMRQTVFQPQPQIDPRHSQAFASTSRYSSPFSSMGQASDQFWTLSRAVHTRPPSNYTPNLIPILRRALNRSHSKGATQRAALCHEELCHISGEFFDSGWGCGYRNFLMACSSLYEQQVIPQYVSLLEQDRGPGVRNLQYWLEKAWSEGFDLVGAEQLKRRLVGTRKWIGAAELYTAFTHRGIPARLIDFPQSGNDPEVVTRWVANYFFPPRATGNAFTALSSVSPIVQTDKPPLILQHQGHSRTIVGIELNRMGVPNLLIFDPGRKIPDSLRAQALSTLPTMQPTSSKSEGNKLKRPQNHEDVDYMSVLRVFRVNLNNLRKRDKYQILAFTLEPPLSNEERSARKIVHSEKVV
ncbi:hypothetical protein FRC14_003588 [Serendipita sp. 396]|nr:hypothetical protein FRC14_003588 [Serendipita sp. 396]